MKEIYLVKKSSQGEHMIRSSKKIYELIESEDIIKFINAQWLRWLGHVIRQTKERKAKEIMIKTPDKSRCRGRPRPRWTGNVQKTRTR